MPIDIEHCLSSQLRTLLYPFTLMLSKVRIKYQCKIVEYSDISKERPVIFALNHSNSFDIPVGGAAIWKTYHRRCDVLVGKQRLWLSDRLFFFLNGAIWVDRKSKEDMRNAKTQLISRLQRGQDILWFPEGTWNLTDNLLMLPMKWGIIDVAMRAKAQIIPVAMEYDRNEMTVDVRFGAPIIPNPETDKAEAIRTLRDAMASLRWICWQNHNTVLRKDLDIIQCRENMFQAVVEYPPIDWEYEQSIIFHPF